MKPVEAAIRGWLLNPGTRRLTLTSPLPHEPPAAVTTSGRGPNPVRAQGQSGEEASSASGAAVGGDMENLDESHFLLL